MKFSVILAFVAAATVVSAETNAGRFARGMAPLTPAKRGSKSESAHGHKPSPKPGKGKGNTVSECNTGSVQCCNYTGTSADSTIINALSVNGLSALVPADALVGLGCSAGSLTTCSQQPVCCNNVHSSSLISFNCNSISL